MFSFYAYFRGHDVYINERNRYASNEILTAYLNLHYEALEEQDYADQLKQCCRKLQFTEDMDYNNYLNYNRTVHASTNIFNELNALILTLPPYDKVLPNPIRTLEDLINEKGFFFESGYDREEGIDWNTVTEYGYGDQADTGRFYIHLTKFCPIDPNEIKYFDPDQQEMLREYNQSITEFFEGYLRFLQSLRIVHRVFKPFVRDYLNSRNTFLQENDLAILYERYALERGNGFDSVACSMEGYGYKILRDEKNQPILCNKMHFWDLQSFLLYDLFKGIECNYVPNQCKNCGQFFLIRSGKYFSYCDCPLEDNPGKTCRDVGARKRYDDKCKTDPVWQTYNRAYKAHYARYMKKKMTTAEFEQWSSMAVELREKASLDQIAFAEYCDAMKK